ncbi:MAG: PASTA domain-containing protein, partial [Wenzhouxiangella sp.]
ARQVWNQWVYSVTNINPDLSVPSPAERNWLTPGLNNYRVNAFLPGEPGGMDTFTYRISDGELFSNEATVYLDIRRPNRPPQFVSTPVKLAATGFDYRYRVSAFDPDPGDQVILSFNQGPAGMTFGSDRVLRWQPASADLGEHLVVLSAMDLEGAITSQEFVLEVVEPVAVPDVIGLDQAAAEAAVAAAGFMSGRISERFDEEFAAGLVAAQQPGGGSLQVPGTGIDLEVSKGPAPIDDSTPPEFPVEAILVEPDELNLLTGETVRLKAFAEFADGSTQLITRAVTWSSDSHSASVNANGRVTAVSGGTATISAEYDGVVGQAIVQITARDTSDNEGPTALISAPEEGEVLFGPTEIIGTAFDDNLVRYELALSPAGEGLWTLLNQGTSNVDEDVLGIFDPTVLLNGFYDIRLRVLDAGGNESIDLITVQADGEQKVGLFTLAFTDLTLPLGGLPITIDRIYDSRDRSMGDFGMGWRLGLRSIELTCSSNLGEDWFVAKSGLSFSLLPMREKACAINLPGGRMEVFDFVVSPSNSPFVPFLTVTGQLQPRTGTLGQIEILDNTNFLILDQQPGEVWLYDDVTFNPFNPVKLRYTMPDGTVFEFTDGKVSRVTDTNGNSLVFSLDGIEHSSGIGVDFERDVLGRITAITDPSGHTQTYAYTANGDLMAHTDALGNTTRFFYNSRHGLVRIEDPLGNSAIRSEYDERGRLIALVDAAGNRTEHEYDDEARLKTTTFPDGSTRVVAYDERGNVENQTQLVTIDGIPVFSEETWEYDNFGNPARFVDADGVVQESEWTDEREWTQRVIDPGGLNLVKQQDFDANGRMTRSIDGVGRESHYEYDSRGNVVLGSGPGGVDVGLSYGQSGHLSTIGNARGERSRILRNAAGLVIAQELVDANGLVLARTEITRNSNGLVTQVREIPLAGESQERVTTFSYDAMSQLLQRVGPVGEIESFEYDAVGNLVATTDPLGSRTEMEYDARGLLIERRLPDGGTEAFDYDYAGRQVRHIDPDGVVHEIEYDELGRVVAERLDGQVLRRTIYSPAGRVRARIDALGNRTDYEYDNAGRMVRMLMPAVFDPATSQPQRPEVLMQYNDASQHTAMTDPIGRVTTYEYNAAGFQDRVIYQDGTVREQVFDQAGRLTAIIDEEGHSTEFDYDGAGRLIRVLQPAPAPGQPRPETRYHYDSFGQMVSRVDALGRVTAFDYDLSGRLIRKVMPDGSQQDLHYDAAGRVESFIDYDGTQIGMQYDPLGRLLQRAAPGLVETIDYTPGGRRSSVLDSRGSTSFSYNSRGQLAGFVEGDGLGIDYQYDANGRLTSLSVDGRTTQYAWDALGRLASVTTPEGTVSYVYDLAGQLVSKTLPNGVVREIAYDLRGRPLEVSFLDPADTLIEQFISTYSPRGKRLSVTTSDGVVETYDYDPIGRLIEASRSGPDPFDLSFEYDPVGNRLRQVFNGLETLYSYGPNHELIAVGADSFSYDARGNRTSAIVKGESIDYQWDAFGRLVGVTTPDGQAEFEYDIDQRRVARVIAGERTRQLVDLQSVSGFDQVIAEYDDSGQVQAHWHYGRQVLAQYRQGSVHYYGTDQHGSVRLLTDSDGLLTDRYDYLPFGGMHAGSGNTDNPYRFNAERYESAARSYDMRARSYDSCSGTFVSRDPFPGFQNRPFSLHPYQFADADPINHIDPLGLATLVELSIAQHMQTGMKAFNIGITSGTVMCKVNTAVKLVKTAQVIVQVATVGMSLRQEGMPFEIDLEWAIADDAKMGIKLERELATGAGKFVFSFTVESGRNAASGEFGVGWGSDADDVWIIGGGGASRKLFGIGVCFQTVATLNANLGVEAQVGRQRMGLTFSGSLSLEPEERLGNALGFGGYEYQIFEVPPIPFR